MAKKKVEDLVWELAMPIAEECNFELIDVEYKKEGKDWFLRVYIDKDGGITLDDCELLSRKLNPILDDQDPIRGSYILEVSSPGLDRPLKKERDFIRYKDREVEVKLYKPYNNSKHFKGINKGIKDDSLNILLDDDSTIKIPMNQVAQVRLYFEF